MSLVLRLKKGGAALQAAPLAGESAPGVLPQPDPAGSDLAAFTPPDTSHLAPCPQCGSPNGLSASACWNCEANLLPRGPFRRGRAPWPATTLPIQSAAPAPDPAPAPVAAPAPVDHQPELSTVAAPALMPAAGGWRRTWQAGASILVVAGFAVGAYLYFPASPPPAGAVKSSGVVDKPPAIPAAARPAPAAPADPIGVANAPPAADATRSAALRALAVEPETPAAAQARQAALAATPPADVPAVPAVATRHSAPQPAAAPPLKVARAGKARGTPRASSAAPPPALPTPDRPAPVSQAPLPVRAACTPTVAALGLCAPASTQTKE